MELMQVQTTADKVLITLDRSAVDAEFLRQLLNRLRVEYLIKKAKFGSEVLELASDIKSNWWEANKERFLVEIGATDNAGRD